MAHGTSERKRYTKGSQIAGEGDNDKAWFVLLSGDVGVYKGELHVETFREPGTVFGELSTILAVPRTATLRAMSDAQVLVVATDIEDLVRNHPEVTKKLLVTLARRLVSTTDVLLMTTREAAGEREKG